MIIQDGASEDGTLEIIKRYAAEDTRIKWQSEPDRGEADALNKALGRADESASYLLWLNADDRISYPHVLAGIHSLFSDWSGVDIIYGNNFTTGYSGGYDRFGILHIPANPLTAHTALRWFNGLNTAQPSIYYRFPVIKKLGYFTEEWPHGIDYELMLRTLAFGYSYRFLNDVFSISRIFRDGAKTGKNRMAELETWTSLMKLFSISELSFPEQIYLWRDYYIYRINNDSTIYEGAGIEWPLIQSQREGFIIALLETNPSMLANKQWIGHNFKDSIWASEAHARVGNLEEAKQLFYQGLVNGEERGELCQYLKRNKTHTGKSLVETLI